MSSEIVDRVRMCVHNEKERAAVVCTACGHPGHRHDTRGTCHTTELVQGDYLRCTCTSFAPPDGWKSAPYVSPTPPPLGGIPKDASDRIPPAPANAAPLPDGSK
jgi:hypothetical protein